MALLHVEVCLFYLSCQSAGGPFGPPPILRKNRVIRNWGIVYFGNFVGALLTVVLMLLAKQYLAGKGAVGLTALQIATAKSILSPIQAFFLGMLCNALVCIAVWLTFSARTTTDKILAIIFPISAFVAAGFEHSVANMYFIPMGLLIKQFAPAAFWATDAFAKATPAITIAAFSQLTWGNFFVNNLIPVTLGNIVGGAGMVGLVYWFVFLARQERLGFQEGIMRAYVLVRCRPGEDRQLTQAVKGQTGVLRAVTTFGPYDAIVEIEAPDLSRLSKIVYDTIRPQPGVIDTVTCLAAESARKSL